MPLEISCPGEEIQKYDICATSAEQARQIAIMQATNLEYICEAGKGCPSQPRITIDPIVAGGECLVQLEPPVYGRSYHVEVRFSCAARIKVKKKKKKEKKKKKKTTKISLKKTSKAAPKVAPRAVLERLGDRGIGVRVAEYRGRPGGRFVTFDVRATASGKDVRAAVEALRAVLREPLQG